MRLLPARILIVLGLIHLIQKPAVFSTSIGPVTADTLIGLLAIIAGVLLFFQRPTAK